jgi:hypothetical protein
MTIVSSSPQSRSARKHGPKALRARRGDPAQSPDQAAARTNPTLCRTPVAFKVRPRVSPPPALPGLLWLSRQPRGTARTGLLQRAGVAAPAGAAQTPPAVPRASTVAAAGRSLPPLCPAIRCCIRVLVVAAALAPESPEDMRCHVACPVLPLTTRREKAPGTNLVASDQCATWQRASRVARHLVHLAGLPYVLPSPGDHWPALRCSWSKSGTSVDQRRSQGRICQYGGQIRWGCGVDKIL